MTDYQGNSHAQRGKTPANAGATDVPQPKPEVKKVVSGEVKVRKKSLGQKLKDVVIQADIKTVARHWAWEVLIPAAKNMAFDGVIYVAGRTFFGHDSRNISRPVMFGGGGITQKISYNNPVQRSIKEIGSRLAPPPIVGPRGRHIYDEVILTTRKDAETVLEMMTEILDNYEIVTIFDLNELCGRPTSPTDNSYGWVGLVGAQIRQVREGYLLELPAPEAVHHQ